MSRFFVTTWKPDTVSFRSIFVMAALWFCFGASALHADDTIVRKQTSHGPLWVTPTDHPDCAKETHVVRGEPLLVTGSGFAAKETVQISIEQGDAQQSVQSAAAKADGTLQLTVKVPADAVTETKIRLRGKGDTTGTSLVSDEFVIFAAGDTDADGMEDICDSCPKAPNADLADSDFDGVGDACDKCPNDMENDTDGDGLCGDVDPDPYEAQH
jgi:hypothetical protein